MTGLVECGESELLAEYRQLDPRCRGLMRRVMRIASVDHAALQRLVDSLAGVAPADKANFIEDWLEIQEAA